MSAFRRISDFARRRGDVLFWDKDFHAAGKTCWRISLHADIPNDER